MTFRSSCSAEQQPSLSLSGEIVACRPAAGARYMAPLSAVEIAKGTPRDAMKGVTQVTEGVFDTLPLEFLSKKTRATHSFVSFFLGTLVGNFCLLVFLAVVLVVSGTFSYMGVADCNVTDPRQMCQDYDGNDFWAAWWLSWGLHFDPGTQTGISALEGAAQKWMVVPFSILGFVLNLIFLGLIVEQVRELLDSCHLHHLQRSVLYSIGVAGATS